MSKIESINLLKSKFNISSLETLEEIKKLNKLYCKGSWRRFFKYLTDVNIFSVALLQSFYEYTEGKQPLSLIYDWEFYSKKYNVDKDTGLQMVYNMKSNKATSLQKFIERHGEEKGTQLYDKFLITSNKPNTDQYYIDKYGETWQQEKILAHRRRSKRCKEYWEVRGYTDVEAIEEIKNYQYKTAGVYLEYYLNIGYSIEDANDILDLINKRKGNNVRNLAYTKKKHPDDWKAIYSAYTQKYREVMISKNLWIDYDLLEGFKNYRKLVNSFTQRSIVLFGDTIKDLTLRGKTFHLDHKYSIKQGFLDEIPAQIIGSPINLEILSATLNQSKKACCSINKDYLLTTYSEFYTNENTNDNSI